MGFDTPGATSARRIEPAEPEPPPTHSIGRVGEDVMGRPGQFVKPCWLAAGGMALVVRNWWRGWRSGLFFRHFSSYFLTFLVGLGKENQQNRRERPTARTSTGNNKKTTKKCESTFCQGVPKLTKIKFFRDIKNHQNIEFSKFRFWMQFSRFSGFWA